MPRTARRKCESGVYHVMLRGINQQQIFHDNEDNEKFLAVLMDCKRMSEFELHAYCIMGNHVHLLIRTGKEELAQIFKRIGVRYVYWYNWKYKRTGHLFQDRYKSEPIEDDSYYLTVLRYIHQNPIKAEISETLDQYPWSSYREYVGETVIADTALAKNMIGLEAFIKYHNAENEDECLEHRVVLRLTDDEVKKIMKRLCRCDTVESFQRIDVQKRNQYVKRLKRTGISIRQISRLTGISKGIIERV